MEDEIRVSRDLADRVEYMVGPPGVAKRIRELTHMPRVQLAFKMAEEIVLGAFGHLEEEAAAEQGVKTGIAILNEGVTVAPVQGIVKVRIKSRRGDFVRGQGSRYLSVYFAGPMRSAGGTELAVVTTLADYVRRLLGLDAYRATEDEIARFIEELRIYERETARFQFHLADETLAKVLGHLPVEVTGLATDPVEVTSYRNIPSIETNSVRGGALRVVNDGIAGRAAKAWKAIEEMGLTGWEWLKDISREKSETDDTQSSYLQDIIGGRPVFSFPSSSQHGGRFRIRYGRARNTGLASVGVHPATMAIVNDFIAVGTQLRLEMPGKAGVANAVDTIEPPIVRLKDGSVIRVESVEAAVKLRGEVDKILFLGDILVAYAEFLENDKSLVPSSFVEEWWICHLRRAVAEKGGSLESMAEKTECSVARLVAFLERPLREKPTPTEAVKISRHLGIPLHPRYCYFWRNIAPQDFKFLRKAMRQCAEESRSMAPASVELDSSPEILVLLERLLIPHSVKDGKIIFDDEAEVLVVCLGLDSSIELPEEFSVLSTVSRAAGFQVKDKYAFFIGARMGRPEKADERKMKPPVHVLFPVGLSGGPQRNVVEAARRATEVEIVRRVCTQCGTVTFQNNCPSCGFATRMERECPRCGRKLAGVSCPQCRVDGRFYQRSLIDIKELLHKACATVKVGSPQLLKGVRGLTNETKVPEPLGKGLLRAKYELMVFKDGTIRYDITNSTLTHFKPQEIGVSVETLRTLGYVLDEDARPLEKSEQICELKPHDIVIPDKCASHLLRVSRFVDDLLERFYGLPPYYSASRKEDLLGQLVIGLSPHTSAGLVGRVVGFTKLNVCYMHPLWIAAKRRDCDGDEDAIMLALDAFLNFSKQYLPAQIGGIMDAPLLLTPILNPQEVDDQVWTVELNADFPLEFYEKSLECIHPKFVKDLVDILEFRLGEPGQFGGYSYVHDVGSINDGCAENVYKRFGTMMEKLRSQMALVSKIEGVDAKDVAKKVLSVHLIRDIMGNLKVFASQSFRCKRCNAKFRRIPLKGKCLRCGGQLSLTVFKGGVEKYLEVAEWLAKTYGLEQYYKQRIELITDEISSLFQEDTEQKSKEIELTDFI